jgi:hypothetical protein
VVSESGLLCLKTGVVGKLPMFSGNLIGTIFLFIGNFGIVPWYNPDGGPVEGIDDRTEVVTGYPIYSESSRGKPNQLCGGEGRRGLYPRGFRGSGSLRGAGRR